MSDGGEKPAGPPGQGGRVITAAARAASEGTSTVAATTLIPRSRFGPQASLSTRRKDPEPLNPRLERNPED